MIGDCAVILTSDPVTFRDPVKLCTSSEVSPNLLEPVTLRFVTFLFVTSKLKALALTVPETF